MSMKAFMKGTLGLMMNRTSGHHIMHITCTFGQQKMLIQDAHGLVNTKVASKGSIMCFLNQKIPKGAYRYTKLVFSKDELVFFLIRFPYRMFF